MEVAFAQLGGPTFAVPEGILRFEQDEAAGTTELRPQVDRGLDREVALGHQCAAHPVQRQ